MALRYSHPDKADFKPDAIFRGNYTQALIDPIPKIAHFVHTDVKELTWLDWAAVRGAIVNLGVKEVHIWLPVKEELKGWIWNRVLEMPEVKLRRITMPKTIYGSAVDTPERQADVVRLKILYEEGGICIDSDLVALKSSDDILYNPTTRATVMAMQHRGAGIPNGFMMSKPGSPFLKGWMQHYRDIEDDKDEKIWDRLSTTRPYTMHQDKDPDLTVLDGNSWFYPLSAEKEGDATLKVLWFGKSWHNIRESYGTHVWHPMEKFAHLIRPQTIKMVDTPLFCQIRKLFDNLDQDGYYSEPPETNPNCSTTWTKDLREKNHRMFSDYRITTDGHELKIIDSSGFNNHGWAPKGMPLLKDDRSVVTSRNVSAKSYAILPVPVDWDARVWSVRMTFQMDPHEIAAGDGVGLFKIRIETGGEILVRVRNDNPYPGITIKLEWHGNSLAKSIYQRIDDNTWIAPVGLPELKTGLHEMALTFDRKTQGLVSLFLDGKLLANGTLPLVASPKVGQEIWFNAQDWDKLDTGFRGTLNRFTMYADALPPDAVGEPLSTASPTLLRLKGSIDIPHATSSPLALLLPFLVVTLVVLFLMRRKKGFVMAIPEYANKIPEYAKNLPPMAKAVPGLVMDMAQRSPWMRRPATET